MNEVLNCESSDIPRTRESEETPPVEYSLKYFRSEVLVNKNRGFLSESMRATSKPAVGKAAFILLCNSSARSSAVYCPGETLMLFQGVMYSGV